MAAACDGRRWVVIDHDGGDEDRRAARGACPFCGEELIRRPHQTALRQPRESDITLLELEVLTSCSDPTCIDQARRFAREARRSRLEKETRADAVNQARSEGSSTGEVRRLLELLDDEDHCARYRGVRREAGSESKT